jgi:hypothetical protein
METLYELQTALHNTDLIYRAPPQRSALTDLRLLVKAADNWIRHLRVQLDFDPLVSSHRRNAVKLLKDPSNRVLHLELAKDATKTDARAVVKWDEPPQVRGPCVPSLWFPIVGVFAHEVVSSLQSYD